MIREDLTLSNYLRRDARKSRIDPEAVIVEVTGLRCPFCKHVGELIRHGKTRVCRCGLNDDGVRQLPDVRDAGMNDDDFQDMADAAHDEYVTEEAIEEARAEGRAIGRVEEQVAIARWLEKAVDPEDGWHNGFAVFEAVRELARDIKRGDHRK